jgi:hypothetical protein
MDAKCCKSKPKERNPKERGAHFRVLVWIDEVDEDGSVGTRKGEVVG